MTRPLPSIMVAPNGARRQKRDVPALPVTAAELTQCVIDCQASGADGYHLHIRGPGGEHSLDENSYRELLALLKDAIPDGYFQITTEAVGQYSADQQRALVRNLWPEAVSIAVRELFRDPAEDQINKAFINDCMDKGVGVQHIVYDAADIFHLSRLVDRTLVPTIDLKLLHVLGSYAAEVVPLADPLGELAERLAIQQARLPASVDWAMCCFGQQETACLASVRAMGAKIRVGFENNVRNSDGSLATSNAERVREVLDAHSKRSAFAQGPSTFRRQK